MTTLKRCFEPPCRKELFMIKFQQQTRKGTEDLASFSENLLTLVERNYPTFQPEAQELLALNRFLDEIKDVRLAIGDRQRTRLPICTRQLQL